MLLLYTGVYCCILLYTVVMIFCIVLSDMILYCIILHVSISETSSDFGDFIDEVEKSSFEPAGGGLRAVSVGASRVCNVDRVLMSAYSLWEEEREVLIETKEFSHDWNGYCDETLHPSAITCV